MILIISIALGNQDLHQDVLDLHSAALEFSSLKLAARPLLDLLSKNHRTELKSHAKTRNKAAAVGALGLLSIIAIACWWNPAGWAAAGAYGVTTLATVGGTGVGIYEQGQRNQASGKEKTVKAGMYSSIIRYTRALRQ